jgi:hypothetical protein
MEDLHSAASRSSSGSRISRNNQNINTQRQLFMQPIGTSKRSLNQIVETGAYETPDYRPRPTKDRQREKQKWIQQLESEAGGADSEPGWTKSTLLRMRAGSGADDGDEEELDEVGMLIEEIEDRKQWLEEMSVINSSSTGGTNGYAAQIRSEISQRIARLKQLNAL